MSIEVRSLLKDFGFLIRQLALVVRDFRRYSFNMPKGKAMYVWGATVIAGIGAFSIVIWALFGGR